MHDLILGTFFLLTIAGNIHAASFDCGEATSEVEKLICGDDELSKMDESLNKAYKNALDIPFAPDELKEEQRNWLTAVRNVCQDSACLKRVYEQRVKSMNLYAQDKMHTLCNEFQHHLNQPAGLIEYAVEEKEIEHEDFNFSVPNIDVDGDKIEDKILLFHTGSGSIVPADYDSVTLILSSTGEKFTVEMQRFYVIVYKAKYYIVASNVQGEKGPVFVDIKSMDRRGIKQVCSYDCGLYGGSCARRRHHKEK
jgi:uncharacterized protein